MDWKRKAYELICTAGWDLSRKGPGQVLALAEVTGSVVVDADLVDQLPNELSELTAPEALVEMVDKETERLIKMDAWEYGDCKIYK